jgi:hypothetical protein
MSGMPKFSELKMKDVTIRIFETAWNGHHGMKLYNNKFHCFLDGQQIETYKILQSVKKAGGIK